MRLLITIPYFEPAWGYGGPPRLVSMIARQLAQRHTVTVLTTDVYDANRRIKNLHERIDGVEIYRFPTISNTIAWKAKIIIPRGFAAAVRHHVQQNDFVFLSDWRHYLNAVTAVPLWQFRKPYSVAAYGQLHKPKDMKYPLKVLFDVIWGKRLLQRASLLFAQTQHEADDYIAHGAKQEQIRLMPLVEMPPTEAEATARGTFRRKYNIPDTTKILLFVGRFHALKGIDILLASFALLREKHQNEDIRLVLIGRDDGYGTTMNALIKNLGVDESVIQTGPLYGEENAAAYRDADMFVFTPTFYEETSLATVRALSFGLPVLTTPFAELPWLDAYKAGVTVAAEPTIIARALTALLGDATLRIQLRTNAQRLFKEHYHCEHVVTILEDDIKRVVQKIPQ